MRRLHAVSLKENFVASGIYQHRQDGLIERWSIHELPDGAQIIRVDKDGRAHNGRSVLIEAWRSPENRIERFDLHGYGRDSDAVKLVKASYVLFDDYVQISRSIDAETALEEMRLPPDCIVRAGGSFMLGLAVAQLAQGEVAPLFSYNEAFTDANRAFAGVIREGTARLIENEVFVLGNREIPAQVYDNRIWLDNDDVLLRDDHMILTQYARRPEPK